jgi:hypothetical protein
VKKNVHDGKNEMKWRQAEIQRNEGRENGLREARKKVKIGIYVRNLQIR